MLCSLSAGFHAHAEGERMLRRRARELAMADRRTQMQDAVSGRTSCDDRQLRRTSGRSWTVVPLQRYERYSYV